MAGLTESPTLAPPMARPAISGPVFSAITLGKAILAPITGPFLPRKTAERCQDVPLTWAFGSHVLTALATTILLMLLCPLIVHGAMCAIDEDHGDSYFDMLGEMLEEFLQAVQHREFWLFLAIACFFIELGFVGIACVLIGWGASDEPLKAGIRRAFRTVWLMTSLCFWGILATFTLAFTTFAVLEVIKQAFYQNTNREDRPFFFRHEEFFVFLFFSAASIWAWWMLLRAVTARPGITQPRLDPMCEYCGYNLSHTPVESRCPECGQPAVQSIGHPRPPTSWEQRRGVRRVGAYVTNLFAAVFRPTRFFRAMPGWSGTATARTIAMLHIALASIASAPFIAALQYIEFNRTIGNVRFAFYSVESAVIHATWPPFWSFMGTFAFVGVTAAIAGVWVSIKHGRNLLVPVLKVFCYCSAIFVLLSVLGPLSFLGMEWFLVDAYHALGLRADWAEAAADCTPIAVSILGLYWWFCIHRAGVRQVIYTNT